MQRKRRNRTMGAVFLAMALCVAGLMPAIMAAAVNTVDTTRTDCTLTVRTPEQDFEELRGEEAVIHVKLYRVAQINADASVGDEEGRGAGAFAAMDVTAYKSGATVKELEELAAKLKAYAENGGMDPAETMEAAKMLEPTAALEVKGGTGQIENLPVGLYLVLPETVNLGAYEYQFNPSLITLPAVIQNRNSNDQEGDSEGQEYSQDLTYDAALTLKPEKAELTAPLRIEKELLQYRTDLGATSFVFEIQAERDDRGGNPKTVYSNVVALTFTEAGVQSIDLTDIPVGSKVTVTEVYDGAAYRPDGDNSWTIAQMPASAEVTVDTTAHFANGYDGTQGWGAAVNNEYKYDTETGLWKAPAGSFASPDNAAE